MSLSSYEDEGLPRVFSAMLQAPDWDEPSLGAFRHFLVQHVALDSNSHGALCRHLVADDRILPLWTAFQSLLVDAGQKLGPDGQGLLALWAQSNVEAAFERPLHRRSMRGPAHDADLVSE